MIAIKSILVATDFGEASDAALRYGMELTRRFNASLHVLHVVNDVAGHTAALSGLPMDLHRVQRALESDARDTLADLVPEPDRTGLRATLVVMTSTTPASAIIGYANDATIDLVIVGTHGRDGLAHFFLGSVAQQVSRTAACPVLTVRPHAREFIRPDSVQTVVH